MMGLLQLTEHVSDGDSDGTGKLFGGVWFVKRGYVNECRAAAVYI